MSIPTRRRLAAVAALSAAALLLPSVALGVRAYRDRGARSLPSDFVRVSESIAEEGWRLDPPVHAAVDGEREAEGDDPRLRARLREALWGPSTPAIRAHHARVAREEAERWADVLPRAPRLADFLVARPDGFIAPTAGGAPAVSWVNLGPASASFEWNGVPYTAVDSGRLAGILVHPQDPETVYVATSGGGIWKTFDFSAAKPTWHPITETLGNLAIGELDLDPQQPETLHVGLGDAFDLPAGQMIRTTTGGASWDAPVTLAATYPASAGSFVASASNVRAVRVDPTDSNHVLVATDVGLFRSVDGGASYGLVDLPNSGAQVAEATWSVVYTGTAGGKSHFVVSGVYACTAGAAPPQAGWGLAAGSAGCASGNAGDVWLSTDGGATWSSRRAAGGLAATNVGRLTVAAGAPKPDPLTTVLYVQAALMNDTDGNGLWRSTDGGQTFVLANGSVGNPTKIAGGTRDCATVNVNGQQAWYNSTLAVDPGNDANVLVGGVLCGLRTRNGTAAAPVWENVSHWLPAASPYGDTAAGTLPYVHADWHRSRIVTLNGQPRAFAGTDGGLYVSDNLFSVTEPTTVSWRSPNDGLVTHLLYSVASGDPANGNPFVAFAGLQDNGTRFRESAANPTTFNQVIGGDGIGSAAGRSADGSVTVYWGSVNGRRNRCVPSAANSQCNQGGAWSSVTVTPLSCTGIADTNPFFVRFAVSQAAATPTFLTLTDRGVFKSVGAAGGWTAISPCLTSPAGNHYARFVSASETVDGLYGVALSGGRFSVTSNCAGSTTACTWTATSALGLDANGDGTITNGERLTYTSSLAFPPGPTGRAAGEDFVVASQAPVMADGTTPLNPAVGLVFRTQDRGATWTPIHGNGTGADLPLLPVNVIRYDPGDLTNNTIFAGTDLGVYRTTDGGQTWHRFGVGLPLVKVTDMFVGKAGQILRIGTYGRGLWEVYPSATAAQGVHGNGDYDRDLQLDFIDLAAMAARLGTTPETSSAPHYDWNSDVTSPAAPDNVSAIDEQDLTTLLSRFGGRP